MTLENGYKLKDKFQHIMAVNAEDIYNVHERITVKTNGREFSSAIQVWDPNERWYKESIENRRLSPSKSGCIFLYGSWVSEYGLNKLGEVQLDFENRVVDLTVTDILHRELTPATSRQEVPVVYVHPDNINFLTEEKFVKVIERWIFHVVAIDIYQVKSLAEALEKDGVGKAHINRKELSYNLDQADMINRLTKWLYALGAIFALAGYFLWCPVKQASSKI